MPKIKAIGFDLFNTLLTIEPSALEDALGRLIVNLSMNGLPVAKESFKESYRESAVRFIHETRLDGKETHNRFWISDALKSHGYEVVPDDSRISAGVEAYFSTFRGRCSLIPGTIETLKALKASYRLGLLSNFTHPPAIREIITALGLVPHFDTLLISGELGYRKPHPLVFTQLTQELGVERDQILYVGDDPEADIMGAKQAGIRPVWCTHVRDNNLPSAQGIAGLSVQDPGEEVARISDWPGLLSLLEKGLS